jgi:hypothetical protein
MGPCSQGGVTVSLALLADDEAWLASQRLDDNLDVADLRPGRPGPAPGDHGLHGSCVSFEDRLY